MLASRHGDVVRYEVQDEDPVGSAEPGAAVD